MIFLYRLFFPFVFLAFLPGLIWKLICRSGYKKSYAERFGIYSGERKKELRDWRGAIWIHAVSVGETNVALTLLKRWVAEHPDQKFILSTTTTTAQEIARNKAPENVKAIFCPIDSGLIVRHVLNLLQPSAIVIFETELWPNMITMASARKIKLALVNARISDKSFRGYRRFRCFFAPVLNCFDAIGVQTELDRDRMIEVAPGLSEKLTVTGNIKFDQNPPEGPGFDFAPVFGPDCKTVVLAASTHSPEEPLILSAFQKVRANHPELSLVLVPRHAERGGEIEKMIQNTGLRYHRRSCDGGSAYPVDILLADTTGELARMIKGAGIVIMGKTFAGNDEGQNIIEPAVMGKPVICGPQLKNFRQALALLVAGKAVCRVETDEELPAALEGLASDPERRLALGDAARITMMKNKGASEKTLHILESLC